MSDTQKTPLTKKIASIFRAVAGSPDPKHFTSVVICAAGSSTRMEKLAGEPRKQFIEIGGVPVVARTMMAYEAADTIHEIIVVAREDELPLYNGFKEKYKLTKLTKVVKGGATRQESARLGSDEVNKKCKFIAVADAARCLTTPEEIQRVCHAAYLHGAASAGIKATDTVKVCDKSGFIESTPDRNHVWMAQTPQVFSTTLYRTAAYVCRDEGVEATDDNSMAEHIRVPVKMVACSKENIKITEPSDIVYATAVLAMRKKAAEAAKAAAQSEGKS